MSQRRAKESPGLAADPRRLGAAVAVAAGVAGILLLVAVLPAEYGMDPTGLGGVFGFAKLSDSGTVDPPTNQSTMFVYRLVWAVESVVAASPSGYTAEGATSNVLVSLSSANITRVTARLEWDDANETAGERTRPDLFELQVFGPGNRAGASDLGRNGPDGRGNVTASLEWRPSPTAKTVRAADDAEAAAEAARLEAADFSGLGTWRIRITLLDAGDAEPQGVPVSGPAGDRGNTWTLSVGVESFRFDPATLNASKQREDTAVVELAPGAGVEYKFDLEEGAPLTYRWNTTGAKVYFDFHGERRGAAPGVFTSHASGAASRSEGEFVAPFSGTHGWYWENQGSERVTVELVTTGVYRIVGTP